LFDMHPDAWMARHHFRSSYAYRLRLGDCGEVTRQRTTPKKLTGLLSKPLLVMLVVTHIISLVEPLRSLPEDDSNLATASASLVDRPIAALSSLQVGRSKSKEFVGSNH